MSRSVLIIVALGLGVLAASEAAQATCDDARPCVRREAPLTAASLMPAVMPETPPPREDPSGEAGGAPLARPPARVTDVTAPAAPGAGGAPWLDSLVWAIPLAGLGSLGAVLLRRRAKGETPPLEAHRRMSPVPPDDVVGLLRNGQAAVTRGAVAEAIAWFEHALRVEPDLGVAHFCKGVCLASAGRSAEAYLALSLACAAAPCELDYRVHLARVAVKLGMHKEAMDALEVVSRDLPELGAEMLEDAQLEPLRDHPRFLMICGAL